MTQTHDGTTVSEDPQLSPEEKEINLRVNKREQRLAVHSEVAGVTRALLDRSDFEEGNRRTVDGDVVAVTGHLPMGVLKIQQNEREHGSFAAVIAG